MEQEFDTMVDEKTLPNPAKTVKNDYKALKEFCINLRETGCNMCDLGKLGPDHIVVSRGNIKSPIMIVGQNPGATEVEQGVPFVGPAGQLLIQLLEKSGIEDKYSAYITNVGLCATEGNKPLTKSQASKCYTHLIAQMKLLAPVVLVAVGKPALDQLVPSCEKLGAIECSGKFYTFNDPIEDITLPVCFILHPAFLLRKRGTSDYQKYFDITMNSLGDLMKNMPRYLQLRTEPVF